MGFYNLHPQAIRELQSPDAGELLRRDGRNLASVLARVPPRVADRIRDYLTRIVPGIEGVERVSLGPKETLLFRQEVKGSEYPWKFYATSMSDGTLRALGALTAAMQLVESETSVRFVGIEEPETALHPAATGALMDALREAVDVTQLAITTHSPDLLDQVRMESECLLVVVSEGGNTKLAPVDEVGKEALRQHLYSVGELFRMDQLRPDPADLKRQTEQLGFSFFGREPKA
jgi:predicted ATPase